jgi:beta-lactamase regulating signal transducer with metallopeptidase domain
MGMIIKSYILLKDYLRSLRLNYCPIYTKTDVSKIIDEICKKYKRKKHFRILYLPTIKIPAIVGIRKPKIIMTATEFSEKELFFIYHMK